MTPNTYLGMYFFFFGMISSKEDSHTGSELKKRVFVYRWIDYE